jgi:hypothetical protein
MVFFALLIQVDKCNGKKQLLSYYIQFFVIFLHRQIETDTGSAGEQPVRDIFDLHEM